MITAFAADEAIEFYKSSAVTEGQIVRLEFGGHHPLVAFDATDGKRYEASTNTWRSVEVGQLVPVRYRPDNPRRSAKLDRFVDLWKPTMFLALLTSLCVIGGLSGKPFKGGRY
ncbi:hypothetical protein BTH42_04210 [Burkholderia sp. SRS-W-2-2016]|nr:hypothetical protein BTH42_04210 [Burkholderia sp. SRS-W-2-2016]